MQRNTRMGSAEVAAAGVDVGGVGDDVDQVGDAGGEAAVEGRADALGVGDELAAAAQGRWDDLNTKQSDALAAWTDKHAKDRANRS